MKALVVGGTGPTGPYIVEGLLKRGYSVSILHRGVHEVSFTQPVEHLHGDPHFPETLEETLAVHTFDIVVALYGRLRHVAQVMRGRTPRFIAVGGASFQRGLPIPIPESAPVITDLNQKFQYLMWVSQQTMMEAHQAGYYSATLFRYPILYGPRQPGAFEWGIIRRILDGRKQLLIPDGGLVLETKAYVENAAHAVLLGVDHPEVSAGQIYNVGDERLLTLRERIELMAKVLSHEWETIDIPYWLARQCLPYAVGARPEAIPQHKVRDLTKIKTELGYRDAVPVEEAIRRTVMWYVENRPEPGGEVERQLGDPFDYDAEDRVIRLFKEFASRTEELPLPEWQYKHPYAHPKKPGA